MNDKIAEIAEDRNLNYSLLATPAEGLSGKFTKKDREVFGIIKNITDKESKMSGTGNMLIKSLSQLTDGNCGGICGALS